MRLLAGLLTGTAFALVVASLLGTPWPLPVRRKTTARARPALLPEHDGSEARVWAGAIALGALTLVVLSALTGSVLVALVPSGLAAALPATAQRSRARKLAKEQVAAWPDALRSILAGLGAGRSPHEALVDLARTGPVALRPVFGRYQSLSQHLGETAALAVVRDGLADPIADRVFEVLIVAVENGSRVAVSILRDVADSTTADIHLAERLDTAQAEERINARVVLVLPFFALVVLCARPGPIRDFYASSEGVPVLLGGAAVSVAGTAVVRRLAQLPTEPRVVLRPEPTEEAQ